jgi:hypothetical protein
LDKTYPYQGPPKYTPIGILGEKMNHLATLLHGDVHPASSFFLSFFRWRSKKNAQKCRKSVCSDEMLFV